MSDGTVPLMVHVPEMPPIMNNITMAVVTSPILLRMAASKSSHGFPNSHMASHTQRPAENSSDTWLAPNMASLPKKLIFNASKITSTAIGTSDMHVRMMEALFMFYFPTMSAAGTITCFTTLPMFPSASFATAYTI